MPSFVVKYLVHDRGEITVEAESAGAAITKVNAMPPADLAARAEHDPDIDAIDAEPASAALCVLCGYDGSTPREGGCPGSPDRSHRFPGDVASVPMKSYPFDPTGLLKDESPAVIEALRQGGFLGEVPTIDPEARGPTKRGDK